MRDQVWTVGSTVTVSLLCVQLFPVDTQDKNGMVCRTILEGIVTFVLIVADGSNQSIFLGMFSIRRISSR